jgi:hypothetical protein
MAARVRNCLFIAEFGLVYIVDVYLNEVSLHISRAKVGKKVILPSLFIKIMRHSGNRGCQKGCTAHSNLISIGFDLAF